MPGEQKSCCRSSSELTSHKFSFPLQIALLIISFAEKPFAEGIAYFSREPLLHLLDTQFSGGSALALRLAELNKITA